MEVDTGATRRIRLNDLCGDGDAVVATITVATYHITFSKFEVVCMPDH